jgi:hypothetical protein
VWHSQVGEMEKLPWATSHHRLALTISPSKILRNLLERGIKTLSKDDVIAVFFHECASWRAEGLELAVFAVQHLAKMLRDFEVRYYKEWHGEGRQPSSGAIDNAESATKRFPRLSSPSRISRRIAASIRRILDGSASSRWTNGRQAGARASQTPRSTAMTHGTGGGC